MSVEPAVRTCRQCGYPLVGTPPPRRCPECGALPVHRARWIEGELHLEGPGAVLPVMARCVGAATVLVLSVAASLVLDAGTLASLRIPLKVDPAWTRLGVDLSMVIAAFLWSRPIRSPGTPDFGLDADARGRRWLMPLQLPWLLHAALLLAEIEATSQGRAVDVNTARLTLMVGIAAQLSWLLAMRHAAKVADFLREGFLRRAVTIWTWTWPLISLAMLLLDLSASRYGSIRWPDSTLSSLWRFSNLGVLIGVVNAVVLAWGTVQCLTMAYERQAADQRREQREAERYRTPS